MREVNGAFQILNLKNDSLRKRYDGIKYDVKRVEEIMYDVSLNGHLSADNYSANAESEHKRIMNIMTQ